MKGKPQPVEEELSADEIRREFQLERMVLFSDAVFAIVITLMAIEIKIPETADLMNEAVFTHELVHLAPVLVSYLISFVFIGVIWAKHLHLFSRLKDYDSGLIIRNLFLLFFIGLFPFATSLVMRFKTFNAAFMVYISLVFLCLLAMQVLQYYIFAQRPNLRRNISVSNELQRIKIFNITLAGFFITLCATYLSPYYITDPAYHSIVLSVGVMLTGLCTLLARKRFTKKKPIS